MGYNLLLMNYNNYVHIRKNDRSYNRKKFIKCYLKTLNVTSIQNIKINKTKYKN